MVAPKSPNMDSTLHNEFDRCYAEYIHHDCRAHDLFDIDVISDAIYGLKRGNAVLVHMVSVLSICILVYLICLFCIGMFRSVSVQVTPYRCLKLRKF
jgi:hypothetical protein